MNTFTPSALAGLLLVAGLPGIAAAKVDVAGGDARRGPAFVTSSELLYLESYPVQVMLRVEGDVPTPCHEPIFEVQDLGDRLDVQLWSLSDPGAICTQVLDPFDLSIPLGSYEEADLPVWLNGEPVGSIEIGDVGGAAALELVAAGWSFGFCAGYCRADLELDGSALRLSGGERPGDEPLYVNEGTLTEAGRAELERALAGIDPSALEPVYGCPDCADGGAAYLAFASGDEESRHDLPFGDPPPELTDAYELTQSLMSALESCSSNELVTVAPDCGAYERV